LIELFGRGAHAFGVGQAKNTVATGERGHGHLKCFKIVTAMNLAIDHILSQLAESTLIHGDWVNVFVTIHDQQCSQLAVISFGGAMP
jgi:hypothetical protein